MENTGAATAATFAVVTVGLVEDRLFAAPVHSGAPQEPTCSGCRWGVGEFANREPIPSVSEIPVSGLLASAAPAIDVAPCEALSPRPEAPSPRPPLLIWSGVADVVWLSAARTASGQADGLAAELRLLMPVGPAGPPIGGCAVPMGDQDRVEVWFWGSRSKRCRGDVRTGNAMAACE